MNKGDAAMQISTADAITRYIPDAEVLISTPFTDIGCGFYKHREMIKRSRRCLSWASFQLLRVMLWDLTNRFGPQPSWLIPERELQEYDLVVDLSGDMLTEDQSPKRQLDRSEDVLGNSHNPRVLPSFLSTDETATIPHQVR